MKKIILEESEYSFNVATRVVTLISHTDLLSEEYLLLITNTTNNTILYNFGCPGYGGVINDTYHTITLEHSTTGMSDSDSLQIVLYTPEDHVDVEQTNLLTLINDSLGELGCIRKQLEINNELLKEILK